VPGARAAFESAVAKDPDSAPARYWLGRACVVNSRSMTFSLAIESFTRALELDPKLAEAHFGIGLARLGYSQKDDARREFELFLAESSPSETPAATRGEAERYLGVLARERGAVDEALAHFDRAQQLDPASADTPYQRGLALESAGRGADAMDSYRAAIELDPNHLPSHFRLARLLRQAGKLEEAAREERIHTLLNQLTDDLTGRTTRAPEKRVELYGELAGLDPANVHARIEYAQALLELRREAEATLALEELMRAAPQLEPESLPAPLRALLKQ